MAKKASKKTVAPKAASQPSKIKIGVIGCGGIARNQHMPGYAKLPYAEIVACCDVVEASAKAAAQQFNVPQVFSDYKKLLKIKEIDAVSVCTPNFMHKQPTVDALMAGKHVLVEKPIAMNGQEGQEMCDAAKASGKKLAVGFNNRWRPEVQHVKKLIDAGEFGEIYYARAQALRRRGIPGWGVFGEKDKQGGGPLIDIGVHILDITLYLMGHPKPVAASGKAYTKFGTRKDVVGLMGQWNTDTFTVEDFAVGLIRFDNGSAATLESSFCANIGPTDIFTTALMGTKAGCDVLPLRIYTEENMQLYDVSPVALKKVDSTHAHEIKLFVDAIRNDTPVAVPGEQGLAVTKILDAIYKSQETDAEVRIN
ncbi:MAG: Gfo/Idh/MocA family oxidoreductase [Planctomycetota bacterium]